MMHLNSKYNYRTILICLNNLQNRKSKKKKTLKDAILFLNGRQKFFKAFEIGIFPKGKQTQGKGRQSILGCVVSDHKQLK